MYKNTPFRMRYLFNVVGLKLHYVNIRVGGVGIS